VTCEADDNTTTFWSLTGNSGTTPGTNFVGTTDNVDLQFRVNNAQILRLKTGNNILGGYQGNSITSGVTNGTISGGGAASHVNTVTDQYGTVSGGMGNRAGDNAGTVSDSPYATVGGGQHNVAAAESSTVAGGQDNIIAGDAERATIGGGYDNSIGAFSLSAAIAGGTHNQANGQSSAVGGGNSNWATGNDSTIGGGAANRATASSSTVPGGYGNQAKGNYSFAAGYNARANAAGCFVWSDNYAGTNPTCSVSNRWVARASGGVYFYTNGAMTSGVYVPAGGGAWATVSDRNLKDNFQPVDGQAVLEQLAGIPITTWNYKSQDSDIRHMGPVAQDFYAAFQVGDDDEHISTIDADGVALAAIQGLYETVQEQEARIAGLEARLEALEKGSRPQAATPLGWLLAGGLVIGGVAVAHRRRD